MKKLFLIINFCIAIFFLPAQHDDFSDIDESITSNYSKGFCIIARRDINELSLPTFFELFISHDGKCITDLFLNDFYNQIIIFRKQ